MITTTHLIEQLSLFPQGARVQAQNGQLLIHHPTRDPAPGIIDVPLKGRARVTKMHAWKGWMDNVFHTAGGRIQRFLLENPAAARCIAFSAVAGLYLDEDDETALQEHACYPRGSGTDYVDHVGEAIVANDLWPLIQTLQAEAEEIPEALRIGPPHRPPVANRQPPLPPSLP